MTTSFAIRTGLNHLLGKYKDFPIINNIKFNPGLEFNNMPVKVIVENVMKSPDNLSTSPWIFAMWDRESIELDTNNSKLVVNCKKPSSHTFYNTRVASCPISLKLIFNNIEMAELFEEVALCRGELGSSFDCDITDYGIYRVSYSGFQLSSRNLLDHDKFGSMVELTYNFKLYYLIIDIGAQNVLELSEIFEKFRILSINFNEFNAAEGFDVETKSGTHLIKTAKINTKGNENEKINK